MTEEELPYAVTNVVGNPYVGVLDDGTQRLPTPRQAIFLCNKMNQQREVLYGGAAGGGKSDAILMAALQYVHVPGYAALILRKSYADLALPGAIMDRAHDWLANTPARWNGDTKTFTFPSGASLSFGYLQTEKDKRRYQGAEFQFVAFDELTQFPEAEYRYLFSRLRRLKGSKVPIRMRAGSNPGGPGHQWVKQRFIGNPINEETGQKRVFISAKLTDNPHLDQSEYIESLMELPILERTRLLNGDWDAEALGNKFRREWVTMVQAHEVPWNELKCVRFWDMAATDPEIGKDPDYTVGALLGFRPTHLDWWILDIIRDRFSPGGAVQMVRNAAQNDTIEVPIRMEQEPGSSGKIAIHHFAEKLLEYDFMGQKPSGNKEVRFNPVSVRMQPEEGEEKGKFHVLEGAWNEALFSELELFPNTDHDDQADAISGAYMQLANGVGGFRTNNYIKSVSKNPVVVQGDLRLVGKEYIDKR